MSCETTCVSHGARAHSYFLRSWHHLTSVGGPYHMALRPVKCLGLNFKLVKYRNRGEMSWHILPELGSFLSKTHFWTHMRSVCVYQVYQCTYSYIYLICTHVHTPHEFSRPKHPDKGFFKLGHKIHPPQNLDYTNDSNPSVSSPSSRAASNSWSFSSEKLGTSVLSRWWLDRWKKCEGHHFEKKKFNPNDRNTSFQLKNQNAYKLTDLFFFSFPQSKPSHPNPSTPTINGRMPGCVFCHASGMTIMITSARSRVPWPSGRLKKPGGDEWLSYSPPLGKIDLLVFKSSPHQLR